VIDAGGEIAALSEELEQRYQMTIAQLRRRLKDEKQHIAALRNARSNPWAETSDLEQHLLDSIEEVKQDIIERCKEHRRNTLANPRRGPPVKEPKDISFADFSATDKRAVIAKLLSKEKVLLFLYGKLFPHKEMQDSSEGGVLPAVGTSNAGLAQNNTV